MAEEGLSPVRYDLGLQLATWKLKFFDFQIIIFPLFSYALKPNWKDCLYDKYAVFNPKEEMCIVYWVFSVSVFQKDKQSKVKG